MSILIFIHSFVKHIVAMWNTVQLCVERSYKSVCLGCFQLSYIDKLYSHCSSEQTLISKNGLGVASALNRNHPVWANKQFMMSVSLTCYIDSILFPQFEDTALFWLNWSRWAAATCSIWYSCYYYKASSCGGGHTGVTARCLTEPSLFKSVFIQ